MSPDHISPEKFYQALQILEQRLGERIERVGSTLEHKLEEHADDDRKVADRVLTLEGRTKALEEQRTEQTGLGRRLQGLIVPAALIAGWEWFKHSKGW